MKHLIEIGKDNHPFPFFQDTKKPSPIQQKQWGLLPTSDSWMLLRKLSFTTSHASTEHVPTALENPMVVLAGDVARILMPDIINFINQLSFSGLLRIFAPDEHVFEVAFTAGEVCFVSSSKTTLSLPYILENLRLVQSAQLNKALLSSTPERIGKYLVEAGLLQSHDLWKALNEQAAEVFSSILQMHVGNFVLFNKIPDEAQPVHTLKLSTQNLLMDAIRKMDEMAHFRTRIPNSNTFPITKKAADEFLNEEELKALKLCDGHNSILDIAFKLQISEFEATSRVYRLMESGHAQLLLKASLVETNTPSEFSSKKNPPLWMESKRTLRVFNIIFKEVFDEIAAQGKSDFFLTRANAALHDEKLASSPLIHQLRFEPDGSIQPTLLLQRLDEMEAQNESQKIHALRKALSDVMFFLLFQAGEILGREKDEALCKRVRELLAMLDVL